MSTHHIAPEVSIREATADQILALLQRIESITFGPSGNARQNAHSPNLVASLMIDAISARVALEVDVEVAKRLRR